MSIETNRRTATNDYIEQDRSTEWSSDIRGNSKIQECRSLASAGIALIILFSLLFISIPSVHAFITCGSSCVTQAQIASDAAAYIANANSGAKCLLTATKNGALSAYQMGASINGKTKATLDGSDRHHGQHLCGADVSAISGWPSSHTASFLLPYICAPVCTGPAACTDVDHDGYALDASAASCSGQCNGVACAGYGDCNDNNAAIKPGATETCNGVDDNCNGQIDEGLALATCGIGPCARTGSTCSSSSCTPGTPSTETCNNVDDNCDGSVDNGITPISTSCGVGACLRTQGQSCSAGAWTPACTPGTPAAETCNAIDDNCDGQVDNGVASISTSCGVGACLRTVSQTCTAGVMGPACTPGTPAASETCGNGLDDNCNGQIDEGCTCTPGQTVACGVAIGICTRGTQTCQPTGQWGTCTGGVQATTEVCNGLDDNCNGQTDEGLALSTCGIGACARTGLTCNPASCAVGAPTTETCNTIDDNCDGQVDNGIASISASCGVGACLRTVTQTCSGGTFGPGCSPGAPAASETCGNSIDDNCNGQVDEGCVCTPGQTMPCGIAIGICTQGVQTCQQSGQWSSCVGGVQAAAAELCPNLLDDNCNGQVDEGCPVLNATNTTCDAGTSQGCTIGICIGTQSCTNGVWASCVAASGQQAETCNGLDDDCDGVIDNNLPTQTVSCGVGACAINTTRTCADGKWSQCTPKPPRTEECNNIDDDCNGVIDNYLKQSCGSNVGLCKQGVQTCVAGIWGACEGGVSVHNETCDGQDNDCNGKIDDGSVCLNTTPPCKEHWTCGAWDSCLSLGNTTQRSCTDENHCGTSLLASVAVRTCTATDVARAIAEHKVPMEKANDNTVILVSVIGTAAVLLLVGFVFTVRRKKKTVSAEQIANDLSKLGAIGKDSAVQSPPNGGQESGQSNTSPVEDAKRPREPLTR